MTHNPKPETNQYWMIRESILNALATQDDEWLESLLKAYPEIARNVIGQAKNARRIKK